MGGGVTSDTAATAEQPAPGGAPYNGNGAGRNWADQGPELLDRALGGIRGLGGQAATGFEHFGDLTATMLDAIVLTVRGIARRTFPWGEFVQQAWFLVSVSMMPAILIAFPLALVIVLEVGSLASTIGAASFTGAVDGIATVREIAPIVTALLLSGAGGSAICADLGARNIRDEISALEVMGIDPIERLVAPRVLATVVIALLLNGIVAFTGVAAGYIADVTVLHGTAGGFLSSFSAFSQGTDVIESMLKAAIFGVIAASVACYKGLTVRRGAAGVGEAVNQSVVITGVSLFIVNLVLTDIFLVLVPPKVI